MRTDAIRGVLAAGGVALAAVAASASGYVGGAGSGPPPESNAPDLASARVTRAVDPRAEAGPQVRFCFDSEVSTARAEAFTVGDYRAGRYDRGIALAFADQDGCVVVTFAPGRDVEQFTTASVAAGGAAGPGDVPVTPGAVPLEQAADAELPLVARPGRTTGPDLIGAEATGAKQITFSFDERLDPTPDVPYAAGRFGYYHDSSSGGSPMQGASVTVAGNRAVVTFADPVTDPKQFAVEAGAVQDVDSDDDANTPSPIADAGTQISGAPGLASARAGNGPALVLTFSKAVRPGEPSAVLAYRDDGTALSAVALAATDDPAVLRATFPGGLQRDPDEVVRAAVLPGAAQAGTSTATLGAAAVGTCACAAGHTDAPDLLAARVHGDARTADFVFDEPLRSGRTPDAAAFALLRRDGSTLTGTDGLRVSGDRTTVTVGFSSPVGAAVGALTAPGAVDDDSPSAHSTLTSYGTVGVGAVQQCPQDPCYATPTPVPAGHVRTRLTALKHRRASRTVTGRVVAKAPCAAGRRLSVRRSGRTIASGRSRRNGSFSLSTRKARGAGPGKLLLAVAVRKVGKVVCDAAAKRV